RLCGDLSRRYGEQRQPLAIHFQASAAQDSLEVACTVERWKEYGLVRKSFAEHADDGERRNRLDLRRQSRENHAALEDRRRAELREAAKNVEVAGGGAGHRQLLEVAAVGIGAKEFAVADSAVKEDRRSVRRPSGDVVVSFLCYGAQVCSVGVDNSDLSRQAGLGDSLRSVGRPYRKVGAYGRAAGGGWHAG